MAPQLAFDEDGNIVVDETSLVTRRQLLLNQPSLETLTRTCTHRHPPHSFLQEHRAPTHVDADFEVVDEDTGNYATSASFSNRARPEQWSVQETRRFYLALQRCGTDFSLILVSLAWLGGCCVHPPFPPPHSHTPRRIVWSPDHVSRPQ